MVYVRCIGFSLELDFEGWSFRVWGLMGFRAL